MFNAMEIASMVQKLDLLVPLVEEKRTHLPTREAAVHLDRAAQTPRIWASEDSGPVRPVRVNGRLAWPVAEIKRVLGVA